MPHWIRVYIVPAAVFQSVLIGGGYGTGREAVEYVTQAGPIGGFLAVGCFFLSLSAVLLATFEFARTFQTFDYRHFFKALLGPAWFLFEILAVLLFLLVLAVVISAASTMAFDWLAVPQLVTTIGVILLTALVLYVGQSAVESLLTIWAGLFSAFLLVVALFALNQQSLVLEGEFFTATGAKGIQYALYNIAAIPVLLYTIKAIRSRREAITAALVAGVAGAFPALLMHMVFVPHLPQILDEALPMLVLIESLGVAWIMPIYAVLLVGTIVQTAIGTLEGVVQRIDGVLIDQNKSQLTKRSRSFIGIAVLAIASVGSSVGVINLIGQGYGTMAWGFMLVYAIPVLTIGIWKVFDHRSVISQEVR